MILLHKPRTNLNSRITSKHFLRNNQMQKMGINQRAKQDNVISIQYTTTKIMR